MMHRTLDNLHHFSTGEAVRPPMSTSPESSSQLRPGLVGKVSAYSAEELNNIYHLVSVSTHCTKVNEDCLEDRIGLCKMTELYCRNK